MQLRQYQERGVIEAATKLAGGVRKLLLQLATGGGKTVMFSAISSRYIAKSGKAVLIVVHREELLLQTRVTLQNSFSITAQPITAGMKTVPVSQVYVGMIESTMKRLDRLYNVGMVIIDEAHRADFFKIHEKFPSALILGFTATPLSANKKKPLNDYFEDIVTCVDIPELIQQGALCQNITYAPTDVVERAALTITGGDFNEGRMGEAYKKPRYVENTVTAYEKHALGTKTLIFNVNISHSEAVCSAFKLRGYNVRHLDGGASGSERRHVLNWFTTTPDAILCSCELLTTGLDVPSIETIIVNRATMSMPLWLQMTGRGARPTPAKSAFTIIDLGGNACTHGDWSASRNWRQIFLNPPRPGEGGTAPVKTCPECEALIYASTNVCPHCGALQPKSERPEETAIESFAVVTKGIDVAAVIKEHRHRKEYYPFFELGTTLAKEAKKTFSTLTPEAVAAVTDKYYELAKQWCGEVTEARKRRRSVLDANLYSKLITPEAYEKELPSTRAVPFNQWHRERAKEHLYLELAKRFKTWSSASIPASASQLAQKQPL